MKRLLLSSLAVASLLLTGCGTVPGAGANVIAAAQDGTLRFGVGAEGGEKPAAIRRADGSVVLAYVGTRSGDRRIYWTHSSDGATFAASQPVDAAEFSDQAPCLVEDAEGELHLFFASNRSGENYRLYHSTFTGAGFGAPEEIAGFDGLQGLAVTYRDGRFLMAAEIMGAGLMVTTSADGSRWTEQELLAQIGFEPAATFLPDGTALVAYQHHGKIFHRASRPGGDWAPEALAVAGADRLRTPSLAWRGTHGELVYAERTPEGYRLGGVKFDKSLKFGGSMALPASPGTDRTPALVSGSDASRGLAWGITLSSGQDGIALKL